MVNNIVVIGDINMPDIEWITRGGQIAIEDNARGGPAPISIRFPTHTNCSEKVVVEADGWRLGKSDHYIFVVEMEYDILQVVGDHTT